MECTKTTIVCCLYSSSLYAVCASICSTYAAELPRIAARIASQLSFQSANTYIREASLVTTDSSFQLASSLISQRKMSASPASHLRCPAGDPISCPGAAAKRKSDKRHSGIEKSRIGLTKAGRKPDAISSPERCLSELPSLSTCIEKTAKQATS